MVSRGGGCLLELPPAARSRASQRLLVDRFPELDPDAAEEIAQTAGAGLPFPMIEMARARVSGSGCGVGHAAAHGAADLPAGRPARPDVQHRRAPRPHRRLGGRDLRPAGAGVDSPGGRARRGRLPLPAPAGARGPGASRLPPHERSRGHQRVAEALAALERPPGQVAHHYLAAGLASRAVPYVVRAVEIAGALGAFRDAPDPGRRRTRARRSGTPAGPAVAPR